MSTDFKRRLWQSSIKIDVADVFPFDGLRTDLVSKARMRAVCNDQEVSCRLASVCKFDGDTIFGGCIVCDLLI